MAQGMHRDALVDVRGRGGGVNGTVELPSPQRVDGILARKQPSPAPDLAQRVPIAPPGAQALQQQRREHRVAVLVAFALFDSERHALAVHVGGLERDDFACAQSGTVGHRQRRAVLQVPGRFDEPRYLLAAEHDRQLVLDPHRAHPGPQLRSAECGLEEELQRRDGRVDRDRRHANVDQVQLKPSHVLGRRRIGRAAQEASQSPHGADIGNLRLVGELAHPHVLDHALAQRGNGLGRFFAHGPAPVGLTRPIASSPTYETEPSA